MKLSDFVAKYLVEKGIRYNFTVPGGGAMHLNSSFGHQEGLNNIYMQHEQGAAIAAEGYYRQSNELPLVCCTTGPGGTNTLTGVLGAWLDSIPMLVISGQVKYTMTTSSTNSDMRIYGDQEFDIVKTASTMTKYAVMVKNPRMIRYYIDKAIYLATTGRPGPVWLDIPQNVQAAQIDENDLDLYDESEDSNGNPRPVSQGVLELIIDKIKQSERPVIYSSAEIRTAGAFDVFNSVIKKLNVPVVTSFDCFDLLEDTDPLYAGRAGDVGNRYGNWAVQNSDFVLVIGSRLGIRQLSYTPEAWARAAFVVMVYPDPLEVTKSRVHVELPVRADVKEFLEAMDRYVKTPLERKDKWFEICNTWKKDYPIVQDKHYASKGNTNPYAFINELSKIVPENTPVTSGNGSACVVGASAFQIKKGQRFILNSGCASMGYCLPSAIGACFASGMHETLCITGDGSIQMNLQELETLVFHKLPIKIFVINNGGYHSMRLTQNNLFKELSNVGVGPETKDLGFPKMERIAAAYDIPYTQINSNEELPGKLKEFMAKEGCGLCEVFVDIDQVFEPKPTAKKLEDGTIVSPPMEDMAPFLPREELEKIMIIPLEERI
ncbi:MAG: thiamine pyrophosphate-binding protein [Lachnospiraceae bacterium]|nr:thiamine pyrophosphate-binding protein [Lachnospiraceae bacterium]